MIHHLDSPGCPGCRFHRRSCPRMGREALAARLLGASHRPQLWLQAEAPITRIVCSPVSAESSAEMKIASGCRNQLVRHLVIEGGAMLECLLGVPESASGSAQMGNTGQ